MHKKTVLLVDDTDLSIELQKSFLRTAQLTLLTANNGHDALSLVRAAPPDLIFIGDRLPGISGVECCRLIKEDATTAKVPVVILSLAPTPNQLDSYRRAGCNEIILKPINRHLFFETARSFLGMHLWTEDRVTTRLPVVISIPGEAAYSAETFDVSDGGLFIETEMICPVGSDVFLAISLPGREEIRCRGLVAWANHGVQQRKPAYPVGVGIEFTTLDKDVRARFDEYLRGVRAPSR